MLEATKNAAISEQPFVFRLLSRIDNVWGCLLAGSMMGLCYAPVGLWGLVFVLLIPVLLAAKHQDPDVRVARGFAFGVGYFCIGSYWFAETLRMHMDYSFAAAFAGHFLITGACALAPTLFCWLAGYLRRSQTLWILTVSALWFVVEDIRFQVFGGGPWLSLGLSQVDSPLAGYYSVLGEVGTSAVVVCIAQLMISGISCAAEQSRDSALRTLTTCILPIALLFALGQYLKGHEWTVSAGEPLPIAIVQSAVTQSEKRDLVSQAERLDELASLSEPFLGKAKLIVWPETVVTLNRNDVDEALTSFGERAMFSRSTVLVGAYEPTLDGKLFNTAFTLGYEGGQKYNKRHLVPFGEYVPNYLEFLDEYVPGDQRRSLGKSTPLIANTGTLFGVGICWEGGFSRDNSPLVRGGAHVLINIANEAWFAGSTLPEQNLDAMRVRAMETERPAIRVANFGPGALIDHHGRLSAKIEADEAGANMGTVMPRTGVTPFLRLGEDFIFLIAFSILVLIMLRNRRAA